MTAIALLHSRAQSEVDRLLLHLDTPLFDQGSRCLPTQRGSSVPSYRGTATCDYQTYVIETLESFDETYLETVDQLLVWSLDAHSTVPPRQVLVHRRYESSNTATLVY